eukprot:Partr_v1_DN27346_c2_g1_i2_m46511 putative tHO complex
MNEIDSTVLQLSQPAAVWKKSPFSRLREAMDTCVRSFPDIIRYAQILDLPQCRLAVAAKYTRHVATLLQEELLEPLSVRKMLENALMDVAFDLLVAGNYPSIFSLLDAAIGLQEESLVDLSCTLSLLELIIDCSVVDKCISILDYMESRLTHLSRDLVANSERGGLFLQISNEMLKRLSRVGHPVVCGRILGILACMYPLGDRSGVNLKGSFVDNEIRFEGKGEFDLPSTLESFDRSQLSLAQLERDPTAFYHVFWKMQDLCDSSANIMKNLPHIKTCVEFTLSVLVEICNSERELSRKPTATSFVGTSSSQLPTDAYAPKYLTEKSLFVLQLRDSTFRKTILLQICILLVHIRGDCSKKLKQDPANAEAEATVTWIKSTVVSMNKLVGPVFFEIIKLIPWVREATWIKWKEEMNCKSFYRPAAHLPAGEKQNREPSTYTVRFVLGIKELARLWKRNEEFNTGHDENLDRVSLQEFLEPLIEQMDPDNMVEREYWLSNDSAYLWKALRLAAQERLDMLERLGEYDIERFTEHFQALTQPLTTSISGDQQPMDIDR